MNYTTEQIKKLIHEYRDYEQLCFNHGGEVDRSRAALYRTIIADLKKLLPRKSMADVDPETWPGFVGTWVEHDGVNKVIFEVDQMSDNSIGLFSPKSGGVGFVWPEHAFLTDHSAAWDSEGNPV